MRTELPRCEDCGVPLERSEMHAGICDYCEWRRTPEGAKQIDTIKSEFESLCDRAQA